MYFIAFLLIFCCQEASLSEITFYRSSAWMHGNVFPGVNSSQVQMPGNLCRGVVQDIGETLVYIQVSRGQHDCYLLAQNSLEYPYHQLPSIRRHYTGSMDIMSVWGYWSVDIPPNQVTFYRCTEYTVYLLPTHYLST